MGRACVEGGEKWDACLLHGDVHVAIEARKNTAVVHSGVELYDHGAPSHLCTHLHEHQPSSLWRPPWTSAAERRRELKSRACIAAPGQHQLQELGRGALGGPDLRRVAHFTDFLSHGKS